MGQRQLGRTRATIAARGVTLEGSPLDFLADQAMEIEEEALLIRFGGESKAQSFLFGAQQQVQLHNANASLARARGISTAISSFGRAAGQFSELGSAGTTLLDGGG